MLTISSFLLPGVIIKIFLHQKCLNWLRKTRGTDPTRGCYGRCLVRNSCRSLVIGTLPLDLAPVVNSLQFVCLLFPPACIGFETLACLCTGPRVELPVPCWFLSSSTAKACLANISSWFQLEASGRLYVWLQHTSFSHLTVFTHALLSDWPLLFSPPFLSPFLPSPTLFLSHCILNIPWKLNHQAEISRSSLDQVTVPTPSKTLLFPVIRNYFCFVLIKIFSYNVFWSYSLPSPTPPTHPYLSIHPTSSSPSLSLSQKKTMESTLCWSTVPCHGAFPEVWLVN